MALESTRTYPIPTKARPGRPRLLHPPMKRNWPGWPESRRRTAHTDAITRWWPREPLRPCAAGLGAARRGVRPLRQAQR